MNRYGTWVDTPAYAHTRTHALTDGGKVRGGCGRAVLMQLWRPNLDDGGQQQQFKASTDSISTTAGAIVLFTEYMRINNY